MPIRSMATTAFHHWIPQSAPWLVKPRPLKPNRCPFSEVHNMSSSGSFEVWMSFSMSLSTSMRKSVTSCASGWFLALSRDFTGESDECGISSSFLSVQVSVEMLCFCTGILMDVSANKSCSCIRLFTRLISATCWQKRKWNYIDVNKVQLLGHWGTI